MTQKLDATKKIWVAVALASAALIGTFFLGRYFGRRELAYDIALSIADPLKAIGTSIDKRASEVKSQESKDDAARAAATEIAANSAASVSVEVCKKRTLRHTNMFGGSSEPNDHESLVVVYRYDCNDEKTRIDAWPVTVRDNFGNELTIEEDVDVKDLLQQINVSAASMHVESVGKGEVGRSLRAYKRPMPNASWFAADFHVKTENKSDVDPLYLKFKP